eukprot:GHVP01030040.1.p1 GENE.GHVP01030040.1~~GHVP01030040.1.p1  ORF type:complete len:190 (+),score=20.96 GHVP01030040.1:85-654(+)
MGGWTSSLWNSFNNIFGSRETRILILGLDNAGKTTILKRLKSPSNTENELEIIHTVPTIGFNLETLNFKGLTLNLWDLGGQTSIRPYWRCYFRNTAAICFVVDAADPDRLLEASRELTFLLKEADLKGSPLLILSNKHDLPGTVKSVELSKTLEVTKIHDREWRLFEISGLRSEGIDEGLTWLVDALKH